MDITCTSTSGLKVQTLRGRVLVTALSPPLSDRAAHSQPSAPWFFFFGASVRPSLSLSHSSLLLPPSSFLSPLSSLHSTFRPCSQSSSERQPRFFLLTSPLCCSNGGVSSQQLLAVLLQVLDETVVLQERYGKP